MGKNLDDIVSDPANKQEAVDITKEVLAGKAMREFGKRRRICLLSSPTLKGAPIDSWFHRGDQRYSKMKQTFKTCIQISTVTTK